jgi:hypothetical protein
MFAGRSVDSPFTSSLVVSAFGRCLRRVGFAKCLDTSSKVSHPNSSKTGAFCWLDFVGGWRRYAEPKAFLRRVQDLKTTKSICNQIKNHGQNKSNAKSRYINKTREPVGSLHPVNERYALLEALQIIKKMSDQSNRLVGVPASGVGSNITVWRRPERMVRREGFRIGYV